MSKPQVATRLNFVQNFFCSSIALTTSGEVYTWKSLDTLAVPSLVLELKGKRIVDIACAGKNV
jgi:hypothetical protein